MTFNSTFDAQTQIISAANTRHSLEAQLLTYDNTNDPTKSIRVGIKTQIKTIQAIIDSGNNYLVSNSIAPFRYQDEAFDSQGNIKTLWNNEADIEGTAKYAAAQVIQPSLSELKSLYNEIDALVVKTGNQLVQKQEEVAKLKSTASPQDSSLVRAQAELDDVVKHAQLLALAKQDLQDAINQTTTVPTEPITDKFSQTIREQIQERLSQNPAFDDLHTQVEAAIVMRKKSLDAFYTAKTPEQKRIATERLNRSASFTDPIVKSIVNYNPNAYADLVTQLDSTLNDLATASQTLYNAGVYLDAATTTNNPTSIASAQAAYDAALADFEQKQKLRIKAVDTLFGFKNSKFYVTMYVDETDVETHQQPKQSGETQTNPNSETKEVYQNSTKDFNAGGDFVYDTKYKVFIPKSEQEPSAPDGRYATARYTTTEEYEELSQKMRDAKISQIYNDQTQKIRNNLATSDAQYQDTAQALKQDLEDERNKENPDQSVIAAKTKQLDDLKAAHDAQQASQLQQLQTYEDEKARNIEASDKQKQQALNLQNIEATPEEARGLTKDFDNAFIQSNQAEREFSVAKNLAIDRAAATNPNVDPTDPNNWSPEDKAMVQGKLQNMNDARANAQTAAVKLDDYANTVPGGRESLLASGLTEADINKKLINVQDTRDKNNTAITGNLTKDQVDLAANSIDRSNVSSTTGFEGLNGGSPFYLQMPTLNSLRDFNIPNGLNPYASATNDDIARDAIHFNIFEVTPPPPRAEVAPGNAGLVVNKVDPVTSSTVGAFTIYPHSHDYLQMSHTHNYDKVGLTASLVDIANQVLDGIDMAGSLIQTGVDSLKKKSEQGIPAKVSHTIEKIDTYTGSNKLDLTIQFKLFTKDDFLNDIFRPLMFLTALSYPKRLLHGNVGDDIQQIGKLFSGKLEEIANSTGKTVQEVETFAAATGGLGPFRYYISKKPEYLSVRHASGLFYFPLAAIKEVSYSFEGAWYNAGKVNQKIQPTGRFNSFVSANIEAVLTQSNQSNPNASIKDRLSAVGTTFVNQAAAIGQAFRQFGQQASDIIQGNEVNLGGADDAFKSISPNSFAYPSIANCSITVSNLVPSFRDDYIQLMNAAANGGSSLVQVTKDQTGSAPAFNPNKPITDIFSQR